MSGGRWITALYGERAQIHNGFKHDDGAEQKPDQPAFLILAVTAFASSIDTLAFGVGPAFVSVNILVAAAAIGAATTVMVILGVMLGRVLGPVVGKRAEIVGDIVLIMVGETLFYEHLSVG